ncbi:MAG: hypothetical protein A3I00_08430 [Betaproteobacteria bacterium RIFCSPLOWO2_02_FULL_64_12]|nr:MAG: hypothetical protein A3I00_08430 [Betaproteobacteria bacterium RIFCSPLOWO2_02_FULL_64_12]
MKLLAIGKWLDLEKGAVITEQGKPVENVIVVYRGTASVEVNGMPRRHVTPPEFIGEVSFLTSDRASATVTATEPMRCLAWPHGELQKLLNRNLSIRFAFRAFMGSDLARKLKERG